MTQKKEQWHLAHMVQICNSLHFTMPRKIVKFLNIKAKDPVLVRWDNDKLIVKFPAMENETDHLIIANLPNKFQDLLWITKEDGNRLAESIFRLIQRNLVFWDKNEILRGK